MAAALGMDPVEVALKNDGAEGHDMAWLDRVRPKWDSRCGIP